MRYTYAIIDLCVIIFPFLFSFHRSIRFDRYFKPYFTANIISAALFIGWDIWFCSKGIWGFNSHYVLGYYFINLPAEEMLFFFAIPFACVFTYHCFDKFVKAKWNPGLEYFFCISFCILLMLTGVYNFQRLYTSVTFITTALLIFVFKFIFRSKWMDNFFTAYLFLLIPFFVVNGLLTGSGLQQPVVWYNNAQNLGIRLHTIPVEDIIYGMELLLLTIFLYEKLKKVHHPVST